MKYLSIIVLLMFASICALQAQTKITGKVTDATNGAGMPYVTVSVKGTTLGSNTDNSGNYSISVPGNNAVLVFSFVGYTTVEQEIGGRNVINVALQSEATSLGEVVVTAMGITKEKRALAYAAQEIKAADLTQVRQTDLNNALVGRVAGVRFWGASGATFDAGKVVLRGTTSLSSASGSEPIYVVDGVITNSNSLNMDDVESVNVLKGPAATALYGSRGGNGAIIITTKRGAKGKGQFEFSQTTGFEVVNLTAKYQSEYGGGTLGADGEMNIFKYDPAAHPSYLQVLDGAPYYDMANDVSWGPRLDGRSYAPFYAWDPTHPKFGQLSTWSPQPEDNVKDLFRVGVNNTTNIAFSKSVDNFSTRVSFTNVQRNGIAENSDATRRFFSISTTYDVNERMRISADYKYTYRKNHNAVSESYGGLGNAVYTFTQWFNRNVNINDLKDYKRPDGTFRSWNITSPTDLTPAFHTNPFALFNEINRTSIDQWNVINTTLNYYIIKDKIAVGAIFNGNIRNSSYEEKVPMNITGELERYNSSDGDPTQSSLWDTQMQGYIAYTDNFLDEKLDVSARLFVEQRDYRYDRTWAFTRDGLIADDFFSTNGSVGLAGGITNRQLLKERSIFGTGSVSWDRTYYIDFSLRNDWSSTLPTKNNSYLYGGLSAAVILSSFTKDIDWLNFWKLRTSMAQVGSSMNPYQVDQTFVVSSRKYNGKTVMFMDSNLKDPNIKPTISTAWEVGTEFRLFTNRLYGDVNFYIKKSKNQIINLAVAPVSGFQTRKMNAGVIENKGYEITLGGSPIRTKDFEWEVYANWAQNTNKLLELDANDASTTQYRISYYGLSSYLYSFAEVGKPIGVIRGSAWDKDPNGNIVYRKLNNNAVGDAVPLRLTSAQKELGNVQPTATGGFGSSFRWKGFVLSMAFDYQIGGKIASVTNMFGEGSGLLKSTVGNNDRGVAIRNPVADGGGIKISGVTRNADGGYDPFTGYMDPSYYFAYTSSIWEPYVYDAGYLKMRELSLNYTLPSSFIEKFNIGLSKASVAFIIQNPWLIYSGIPNVDASAIGNSYNNFIETGQAFSTRVFGFSVNLTF